MKLRTYQAWTMQEALAAVEGDLGRDAVILRTRTTKRGGFLGLGRRTVVEVTAQKRVESSTETAAPASAPKARGKSKQRARRSSGGSRVATRAYASDSPSSTAHATQHESGTDRPAPDAAAIALATANAANAAGGMSERERTRRLAQAMLERAERRQRAAAEEKASRTPATITPPPQPAIAPDAALARMPVKPAHEVAQRFVLQAETEAAAKRVAATGALRSRAGSAPASAPAPAVSATASRELQSIESAVGRVLENRPGTVSPRTTPRTQASSKKARSKASPDRAAPAAGGWRSVLRAQGVASSLLEHLLHDLPGGEPKAAARVIRDRIAAMIPVVPASDLVRPGAGGRPRVVAIIGPTGVGKTTTLAKLAASLRLRHGVSVGLVTADTYRIAAVDQLRTYAEIIGVPLAVAHEVDGIREVIDGLGEHDLILVDTPGRSRRDESRLTELHSVVKAAKPDQTHLVLSAATDQAVLQREVEAFRPAGFDRVVMTKLDEAARYGSILNLGVQLRKPFSFVTTGQEVPDHIEAADAKRLATLMCGGGLHA